MKMSLNLDEKQELYKSLIRIGIDEDTARNRVNKTNRYLEVFQRKRMIPEKEEKTEVENE